MQELDRKNKLLAAIRSVESSAIKPLPVLRDLTDLLPNDAWLTMVSLDGKGVELTGQAAAASALIPLLENSPRLERVEFASPVTRGRDREQFRILAKWEGPGANAVTAEASPATGAAASRPGSGQRPNPAGTAITTPTPAVTSPRAPDASGTTPPEVGTPRRRTTPNLGDVREPRP